MSPNKPSYKTNTMCLLIRISTCSGDSCVTGLTKYSWFYSQDQKIPLELYHLNAANKAMQNSVNQACMVLSKAQNSWVDKPCWLSTAIRIVCEFDGFALTPTGLPSFNTNCQTFGTFGTFGSFAFKPRSVRCNGSTYPRWNINYFIRLKFDSHKSKRNWLPPAGDRALFRWIFVKKTHTIMGSCASLMVS